jgi:hypothetical protein
MANPASYVNLIDVGSAAGGTINPVTTSSVTQSVFVETLNNYNVIVNQGTGGSSVTFALDGSDDNVNWVQNLVQVAGVTGGATPVPMNYSGVLYRFIRVRVVTGVAATTISSISISASMSSSYSRVQASPGTLIDRSGTTSGTPSTSTTVAAANPSRKYFIIQNLGASNIYVNFTSAANTTSSILLAASGGSFVMESSFVSTEAITVLSAGTSVAYMAKEA